MATDQLSMFGAEEILKTKGGKAVSFNLSKSINGPQQSVFDHWLIPVFVGEWMFGPKIQAEEIITLNNVVRKNGSFEYAVNRGGKKVVSSIIGLDAYGCDLNETAKTFSRKLGTGAAAM